MDSSTHVLSNTFKAHYEKIIQDINHTLDWISAGNTTVDVPIVTEILKIANKDTLELITSKLTKSYDVITTLYSYIKLLHDNVFNEVHKLQECNTLLQDMSSKENFDRSL